MTRFITSTKTPLIDTAKYSVAILASLPLGRSLTGTPISLYPVNNRYNVLGAQYDAIKTVFPKSDVFLITGYNTHQIVGQKPNGLRIIENQKYQTCGEAEEVRLVLNAINTPSVITISGDLLFDETALNQIKTKHSSILIDPSIHDDSVVGTINNKSKLENMSYGIQNKWCGIAHFANKELFSLVQAANVKSKANLCLFELINYIIHHRHGIIYTVEHNAGYIQKVVK